MPTAHEPADRYEKPGEGNDPQYASLREAFRSEFGDDDPEHNPLNDAPINVVHAPGRVNLIGEHVDYHEGIVFPMAIQPRITFAFRRRGDGQVRAYSEERPNEDVRFKIDDPMPPRENRDWSKYIRAPLQVLNTDGHLVMGMNLYLMNSLADGAGLSSSAALEVGTTLAALHLGGGTLTPLEIADICYRAEHDVVGVPVGRMDMTAVAAAREGHAMMLDCRTMEIRHVPLDAEKVRVIVFDSGYQHELYDGGYESRRRESEAAAAKLGVRTLRDATLAQVEAAKSSLSDVEFRRARHVVSEIGRTIAFAESLEAGDYGRAGQLMYESHDSLRDDYNVSIEPLDFLVEATHGLPGVYGSRMTGGGFGGCTVTLCEAGAAPAVRAALLERYDASGHRDRAKNKATVPFDTPAAAGARVVD